MLQNHADMIVDTKSINF